MEISSKWNRHGIVIVPLVFIALLGCVPVSAQEASAPYTMTIIIDKAYGGRVAAGKYGSAIDKITASKRDFDLFAKHTNLCVAYTKIRNIDNATVSCEAALSVIREEGEADRHGRSNHEYDRSHREYVALALSNLGVLDVVKGSPETARARFEEAVDLGPGIPAAQANLGRLTADL